MVGRRETEFLDPFWEAAAALLTTPAPNLNAALFKVELVFVEELDNDGRVTSDPMAVILDDIRRLGMDPARSLTRLLIPMLFEQVLDNYRFLRSHAEPDNLLAIRMEA